MLARIIGELGPWNWVAIGLVLLVMEIAIPGVFLLWFGLAAILVGAATIMFAHASFWPWEAQIIVFVILAIGLAWRGRQMMDKTGESDEPLLNRRSEQLIGRTSVLEEPVSEGYGRIRLGDTLWRVKGPDLPAGTRVRVAGVQGSELVVEAA